MQVLKSDNPSIKAMLDYGSLFAEAETNHNILR